MDVGEVHKVLGNGHQGRLRQFSLGLWPQVGRFQCSILETLIQYVIFLFKERDGVNLGRGSGWWLGEIGVGSGGGHDQSTLYLCMIKL